MAFHLITEYSAALLGIPFLACFSVAWKPEVAWRGVINDPPTVSHKKTSSTDHPYERRIPHPKQKTFSFNTFQLPTIFNLHFPPIQNSKSSASRRDRSVSARVPDKAAWWSQRVKESHGISKGNWQFRNFLYFYTCLHMSQASENPRTMRSSIPAQ